MKNIAVVNLNCFVRENENYENMPLAFASVVDNYFRFVTVTRAYHDTMGDMNPIREAAEKYLKSEEGGFIYNIVDNEEDLIGNVFRKLYTMKPDLATVWHMDWSIRKMFEYLAATGNSPERVMCYADVPVEDRRAKYTPGLKKLPLTGERVLPIHPADQKHRFELTADFKFIDAMRVYRNSFRADKDKTYQLSKIFEKHGIQNQVPNPFPDLLGIAWNVKTQREEPLLYLMDSVADSMRLLELDKQTGFLSNLSAEEEAQY